MPVKYNIVITGTCVCVCVCVCVQMACVDMHVHVHACVMCVWVCGRVRARMFLHTRTLSVHSYRKKNASKDQRFDGLAANLAVKWVVCKNTNVCTCAGGTLIVVCLQFVCFPGNCGLQYVCYLYLELCKNGTMSNCSVHSSNTPVHVHMWRHCP